MPPDSTYLTGGSLGHGPRPAAHRRPRTTTTPPTPSFRVDAFDLPDGPDARPRPRPDASCSGQRRGAPAATTAADGSLARFRERALDLLAGSAARRASTSTREDPRVRDRYGRHPLGQNLLLARRLIEAGVRLVSVVGWCGLAPGDKFLSVETWDMHGNAGIDIFGNGWNGLGWALPCCDQAVSALLEDLRPARPARHHARGAGRASSAARPRSAGAARRSAATTGPTATRPCSPGPGCAAGRSTARSDKQAAYVKDRPVSPEDFAATLFHALGIPPETPDPSRWLLRPRQHGDPDPRPVLEGTRRFPSAPCRVPGQPSGRTPPNRTTVGRILARDDPRAPELGLAMHVSSCENNDDPFRQALEDCRANRRGDVDDGSTRIRVARHAAGNGGGLGGSSGRRPGFERDVLPILRAHCLKCHGTAQRKGGLSLRTPAAMLEGGDSGPALVKGNVDESLIVEQVESGEMPPGKAAKLSAGRGRHAQGLDRRREPRPTARPRPRRPTTTSRSTGPSGRRRGPRCRGRRPARVRNPIDAFLLARLEAAGLTFSPEADRLTLLRRATFDLSGLAADAGGGRRLPRRHRAGRLRAADRPAAGVPRITASAGAGTGSTWPATPTREGILDADYVRTAAWRYRDYVIRAFNADKPYDRFLKEQIAGDELTDYWTAYQHARRRCPPRWSRRWSPPAILRCASDTSRPDFVNIKNAPGYYYQTLDDTVKIVAIVDAGPDGPVRQVPQPQVRPDPADRLLPDAGGLHERLPARAVGAAGAAAACSRRPRRRRRRPRRTTPRSTRRSPGAEGSIGDADSGRSASDCSQDRLAALPDADPRGRARRPRAPSRRSGTRCRSTSSASSQRELRPAAADAAAACCAATRSRAANAT